MNRIAAGAPLIFILAFTLAPFIALGMAAGAPLSLLSQSVHGLDLGAAVQAWDPANAAQALQGSEGGLLLTSLARTLVLSLSVGAATSSLAILGGFVSTRSRVPLMKLGVRTAPLLAYALPSVFLVIAAPAWLYGLPPLWQVWSLHFIYLFPLAAILAVATCLTLPKALERSAAIDGAGWITRFRLIWSATLWPTHVGIFCISALISWSDIVFSNYFLAERDKLIVDLYVLRYFDQTSSVVRYDSAAVFGVILTLLALGMSAIVARTLAFGTARPLARPQGSQA